MNIRFTLPSNPNITIDLREASVSDAMDFSEINKDCEEEAITQFLNKLQSSENKTDSSLWTGEDRRYGLFSYLVNTTNNKDIAITYHCDLCDEKHVTSINLSDIWNSYNPIDGECFREFAHDGRNIIVHPLFGRALENLEQLRLDATYLKEMLDDIDNITGDIKEIRILEKKIRKKQVHIAMYKILSHIDIPSLDTGLDELSRKSLVEKFLTEMTSTDFREFVEKLQNKLPEMKHGLNMVTSSDGALYLITPLVKCEKHPESEGEKLRFPFRTWNIIPYI